MTQDNTVREALAPILKKHINWWDGDREAGPIVLELADDIRAALDSLDSGEGAPEPKLWYCGNCGEPAEDLRTAKEIRAAMLQQCVEVVERAQDEGVITGLVHSVLHDLRALSAPASGEGDGWRSIETAPKDRRILLFAPPYGAGSGNWTEQGWRLHFCLNKDAQPTHWKPSPLPPAPANPATRGPASDKDGDTTDWRSMERAPFGEVKTVLLSDADEDTPQPVEAGLVEAVDALLAEVERTADSHDWLGPIADLKLARAQAQPHPGGEQCHSCGRCYAVVYRVPNDVWAKITPKRAELGPHPEYQFGGLLCPDCAAAEAAKVGIALYFNAAEDWPENRQQPGGEEGAGDCPTCYGTGLNNAFNDPGRSDDGRCPMCMGHGHMSDLDDSARPETRYIDTPCPHCTGTGRRPSPTSPPPAGPGWEQAREQAAQIAENTYDEHNFTSRRGKHEEGRQYGQVEAGLKIAAAVRAMQPDNGDVDDEARAEHDEYFKIGFDDGYQKGVQDAHIAIGGDGEYVASTDPSRDCRDPRTMLKRINERIVAADARAEAAEKRVREALTMLNDYAEECAFLQSDEAGPAREMFEQVRAVLTGGE